MYRLLHTTNAYSFEAIQFLLGRISFEISFVADPRERGSATQPSPLGASPHPNPNNREIYLLRECIYIYPPTIRTLKLTKKSFTRYTEVGNTWGTRHTTRRNTPAVSTSTYPPHRYEKKKKKKKKNPVKTSISNTNLGGLSVLDQRTITRLKATRLSHNATRWQA